MNLFKIFIPKENAQQVTELESYTLRWEIQGDMYGSKIVQHKCFIHLHEAKEFEKQLKSSAKFIGTWINVSIDKN